ncbi:ETX/MTX2 family pore-forming toxin [Bacillus toyonensis]|uniref:Uncharacterized protein n=1 Tax=Bacillus toyonensis TaxID=155322 RepID=A0A2A8GYU4_9BACI|nr:ETX/MTX2 family pore-forming toxin [Bacillus toyonensis]PEP85132.1 hypothetical protein CN585_30625 [Bacillus toyonensis]
MEMYKKIAKVVPVAVLSSAILFSTGTAFAANDMSSAEKKGYPQDMVEKLDSGTNNRTHSMYETINNLLHSDDLNERTNWKGDSYNFIRFNYLILPSQEQDVLNQLNTIPKDNVELKQVLKVLNGYHNKTNAITDVTTLQVSDMNVNKYIEEPKPDPNADQYFNIDASVKNANYSEKLTLPTQGINKEYTSSKEFTTTHTLNAGIKQGIKSSLNVGVPGVGQLTGEMSFEYQVNYGYSNQTRTMDTVKHTVQAPSIPVQLPARTGAVAKATLSTPIVVTKLQGTTKIKGFYTDQVNSYPTQVQLGIYNKFKVISQHNPTIWSKLQELGFNLDDRTQSVIFNGTIDLNVKKEPGSSYDLTVQLYELDANDQINYNKPYGKPETSTGQVQTTNESKENATLRLAPIK